MDKQICFITCLFMAFCGTTASTIIECNFNVTYFHALDRIYRCLVGKNQQNPNITTHESAIISNVVGIQLNSKTNDDVIGFIAEERTFQYFPQGLELIFKNLKAIHFFNCKLKEIHQSDLKPFRKLVHVFLMLNGIEVIEEGLFDYNPDLEVIGIHETKIIHIDPNVFDNLPKLNNFGFYYTPCVKQNVQDSRDKVKQLIQVVKNKCGNSEYLSLNEKIKKLKNESKSMESEAFSAKLKSLETSLQKSKFSNYSTFMKQLESFKFPKIDDSITLGGKNVKDGKPEPLESSNTNTVENATNIIESCSVCCSMDQISASFNNITVSYTDLKSSQEEMKNSINYLKSAYDKLEESLKYNSSTENATIDDKYSILDEKLESLEESLINSVSQNTRKLEEIQKEFELTRYKILISIDGKIKLIESRVMEKVEKVLDDKLGKIFKALNIEN